MFPPLYAQKRAMEAIQVTLVIYPPSSNRGRSVPSRQISKVYLFDVAEQGDVRLADALGELTRDEDNVDFDEPAMVKYHNSFHYCPISDNASSTACCPTTPLYALLLAAPKPRDAMPHLVVAIKSLQTKK